MSAVLEDEGERDADPRWWRFVIYGALAFAVVTFLYVGGRGAAQAAPPSRPASLAGVVGDPAALAAGKDIFAANCAPCHGAGAGGQIGPNLTDAFWLHGGRPEDILHSVHDGWAQKGMPAWGLVLGEDKVRAVVAYVVSLKDTNVAGGKPPEGEHE